MNTKKIFITGVTGVLGKQLVPLLQRQRNYIVGLCRSEKNMEYCNYSGIEGRYGDIFDGKSMIELTSDCDVIIHLATRMPTAKLPTKNDWKENDRIRVEGTSNLVDAALLNKIKLFI